MCIKVVVSVAAYQHILLKDTSSWVERLDNQNSSMFFFLTIDRFFVLLFVYLVGGIIFNKTRREAQGLEMVPNIAFWKALPGLVKVSTSISFRLTMKQNKTSTYVTKWKGLHADAMITLEIIDIYSFYIRSELKISSNGNKIKIQLSREY